ncbi:hypothetical protein ADP71_02470 [Vitreoscilla sp. C1]|uniref:hypothetical protein n=1 Tax=Vitreoscilla sp. (strain C1) TaxID=96942 RepID=UPI000CDCC1FE|nr:hypothetical protein [Vitreoscilla sp. C1]AUZ04067.1 hypothetical protein ADP71_02470 [Vitreoscilla sp. C1]
MENQLKNKAIPSRLIPCFSVLQTDAIQRQPYHQLRPVKDVIVEALELSSVGVFDANGVAVMGVTDTGHARYCQQATKNMTNPNK